MKLIVIAVLAAVVGAVGGLATARVYCAREVRSQFAVALAGAADKQEYTSLICLAALNQLEAGDMDKAKHRLVYEIASYYHHPLGQADSPQRKKLMASIEAMRLKSNTLDEEIRKQAP